MTPYSEIFKAFLAEVNDDFYIMPEFPTQELEETVLTDLTSLLQKAIVSFSYPKVDLRDRDDALRQFNQTLDIDEIEILATGMIVAWARRELYNTDITSQTLTTKDFNGFSQASHINALIKLNERAQKRLKQEQIRYSMRKKDGTTNFLILGE